jgi:hypothetical protein
MIKAFIAALVLAAASLADQQMSCGRYTDAELKTRAWDRAFIPPLGRSGIRWIAGRLPAMLPMAVRHCPSNEPRAIVRSAPMSAIIGIVLAWSWCRRYPAHEGVHLRPDTRSARPTLKRGRDRGCDPLRATLDLNPQLREQCGAEELGPIRVSLWDGLGKTWQSKVSTAKGRCLGAAALFPGFKIFEMKLLRLPGLRSFPGHLCSSYRIC